MTSPSTSSGPVNRLAREKSPYLLQHQFNPVDWYPWGNEAFARARAESKPIFLSIGYSTCHWCHVMERESFENPALAEVLNRHFISIKIDREERPDVDNIYMTFVQATTGQGGWPLSVFLTPDLQPFYGGTYFPPENRYGRPGFRQVLERLAELWSTRRDELAQSAAQIQSRLAQAVRESQQTGGGAVSPQLLRRAGDLLKQNFDEVHGGFGRAPKFPQPSHPAFLLRYALRFHDPDALRMVLRTCEKMAAGGINDQLGGGFARYSVDAEWLVPHFEKMLYDNAQLVHLYLDAFLAAEDPLHAEVAQRTLDYVLRDMTHPEGGFYSAEDADSEGHEGKFYCWTREELSRLLGPEEAGVVFRHFGISEAGNFVDHSHPEPLRNQNVLSIADPSLSAEEEKLLESGKAKMFAARSRRIRPHLDDKVLVSWNGLMLSAMTRAAAVLGEDRYRQVAERNLRFLRAQLWDPGTRTLYHRWREGERDQVQLLKGYAFLLLGIVDHYEATLDEDALEFALSLADSMIERFYDPDHGGFWQTPAGMGDLIIRSKEDYDGAEPSGNSVAVMALLKLGRITGRTGLLQAAEKTLRFFSARLTETPQALPFLLQAFDFSLDEPRRIVIAGNPADPRTRALIQAAHSVFQPNKIVTGTRGPVEEFARTLPGGEVPLAYPCTGQECQKPTSNPVEIQRFLRQAPAFQ